MWCGGGTGAEEEKEQEQDLKKHCPTHSFYGGKNVITQGTIVMI